MAGPKDLTRGDRVERTFGLLFAGVFVAVGVWPLWTGEDVRPWAVVVAAVFTVVALARPRLLRLPSMVWLKSGAMLGGFATPVVMGILFFAMVTPMGLFMRAFGKEFLRLEPDPGQSSYWIERTSPGPVSGSMFNQF
jgi:hypothetical protein